MSEHEDDRRAPDGGRLERELRGLLAARDPGPIPAGLRDRIDRLPDSSAVSRMALARRAVIPVLGIAAAVLLLFLAAPLIVPIGYGPGPGASAAPTATFDPALRGPGLVPPPAIDARTIVILGLLLVGCLVFVLAPSGPRRGVVTIVVVGVLMYGGAQVLVTRAVAGPVASSGGIGVLNVEQTNRTGRYPVYISATPGGPFSFGFSVANDGPLPIRLEGVVADPALQDGAVDYPTLRAVWWTGGSNGDIIDPTQPFLPVELAPNDYVFLWLVGTASTCAAGPSFDPGRDELAMVGMPGPLWVEYTVLGFPSMAAIDLPFELLQPYRTGCPPS